MVYYLEHILFGKTPLNIIATCDIYPDHIILNVVLQYPSISDDGVIYKTWKRAKFGHFDPDEMLPKPDQRVSVIAQKLQKMGKERFENRFKTLLSTRPHIDVGDSIGG